MAPSCMELLITPVFQKSILTSLGEAAGSVQFRVSSCFFDKFNVNFKILPFFNDDSRNKRAFSYFR